MSKEEIAPLNDSTRSPIALYALDLQQPEQPIEMASLSLADPAHCYWLHFCYTDQNAQHWLREKSGLDDLSIEHLLSEESRPRTLIHDDALLIALRGVNLAKGSDPTDMVAVRLWLDSRHLISTRNRPLLTLQELASRVAQGNGPRTSGQLLAEIVTGLTDKLQPIVEQLEESLAEVEETIDEIEIYKARSVLAQIRRQAISLRRYMAPQKEALNYLQDAPNSILDSRDKLQIREANNHLIRNMEDLESIRDRAMIAYEEVANRLAEQLNSRMYLLAIITTIFLPLGFLTGLLGINVGGIPGAENDWAFWIVVALVAVIILIQILYFRSRKWL
jgi:zinc transporter